MDPLTAGADVGAMLTGLSAVTAAYVWTRRQVRERRERRAARSARNWHGYIEPGGINSWDVRIAEDPAEPTARVVLDVADSDGNPRPCNGLRTCGSTSSVTGCWPVRRLRRNAIS